MSEPFVNFGTDKNGDWARCIKCEKKYRDWSPKGFAVALCPACGRAEADARLNAAVQKKSAE